MEMDAAIIRKVKEYYLRPEIIEKIFSVSCGREVIPVFLGTQFGRRPDAVQFVGDIEYMVKKGATSFHCSLEHWPNPLQLSGSMKKNEMDNIRTGWDIFFDIDANEDLEHGRIAARLMIDALNAHGIKNVSLKFSGRRGFHIGVSCKSLPKKVNSLPVEAQYPLLLQKIADYLRDYMREELVAKLIEYDKSLESKMEGDPYKIVEVEHNWSYRHLFRMPYSFNEKTWLVSLPIPADKLEEFRIEDARPENVRGDAGFLDKFEEDEAIDLVMEALDYDIEVISTDEKKVIKKVILPKDAVCEEFFPPCIQNILLGLKDGRKRGVFILINFLRSTGWSYDAIDAKLDEWNKKNPDSLPDSYVQGQLNYAKTKEEVFPAPNCDNKGYYTDIQVCKPDNFCKRVKNPTTYALLKAKNIKRKGSS
ncbi:MAG: DNA primase small subunit domain-containing protein [archaeon]